MALRVSAGNDDRSISIDVAVSVANGRVLAAATVASASGVGRRGLEKRREVARNAEVTAVTNGRTMPLVISSSPLSRRAEAVDIDDECCGRLKLKPADLVVGAVNASAPSRDDAANETAAMAVSKERQDERRFIVRGGSKCRRRQED